VEVYEWEPDRRPGDVVAGAVDGATANGDGVIVLLHTWPDAVAPALAEIVERLRDAGMHFVRVDALDVGTGLTPIASPRPAVPTATA
jgi:hypothetical protein